MVGTNLVEEIDCGNFFDHIDDLIEFPNNDIENAFVGDGGVGCKDFTSLWPENSFDSELHRSDSVFSCADCHSSSDITAELSVPYENMVQLEWLSTFVEDSFSSGGLAREKSQSSSSLRNSYVNQFQTSSPLSVLESSSASACSNGKPIPISHEKRPRTKRPRSSAFTPTVAIQLISPTSSITEKGPMPVPAEPLKKKKKIKILPPTSLGGASQNQNEHPNANPQLQAVWKCMHCEIAKTPQWRAGPMGPKSLCNACGVRYKSGRLFPEYRPVASPTFVPSLHSNCHKKVVEMRTRNNGDKSGLVASGTTAPTSAAGASCLP